MAVQDTIQLIFQATGIEAAVRSVGSLDKTLNLVAQRVGIMSNDFQTATRSVIALGDALKTGKGTITGNIAEYQRLQAALQKLTQQHFAVVASGKQSNQQTAQQQQDIRTLQSALQSVGGVLKGQAKDFIQAAGGMAAFGKATGMTAAQIQAFTGAQNQAAHGQADFLGNIDLAIGRLLKYRIAWAIIRGAVDTVKESVQEFMKINSQLSQLAIVVDPGTMSLEKLRMTAFKLSQQFGVTTGDVLESFNIWARVGLQGEEIVQAARATLLGVNALGMDVGRMTDALTSVMFTYGVSAAGTVKVISEWIRVANAFPLAGADLANGLFAVGSAAKEVGIDLQDLGGYIAAINAITRKSGTAIGQSLKTQLARLVKPETEKLFNDLGIAIRSTVDEYRDMDAVLGDLAKQWDNLSQVQRTNIAVAVGGIRRYVDFLALMDNWDLKTRAVALANGATNEALRANDITMASFSKKVAQMNTVLDNFKYSLGGDLAKSLTNVVYLFSQLMSTLSSPAWIKTIGFVVKLTTSFVGVGVTISALWFISNRLMAALGGVAEALGASAIAAWANAKALRAVAVAEGEATVGAGLFNKALSAGILGKILWITTAITGLLLALDLFGPKLSQASTDFSEFAIRGVEAAKSQADAAQQLVDSYNATEQKIVDNLHVLRIATKGTEEYNSALKNLGAEILSVGSVAPKLAQQILEIQQQIMAGKDVKLFNIPAAPNLIGKPVVDFSELDIKATNDLIAAKARLKDEVGLRLKQIPAEITQTKSLLTEYSNLRDMLLILSKGFADISDIASKTNFEPKFEIKQINFGQKAKVASLTKEFVDELSKQLNLQLASNNRDLIDLDVIGLTNLLEIQLKTIVDDPKLPKTVKDEFQNIFDGVKAAVASESEALQNVITITPIFDKTGAVDMLATMEKFQTRLVSIAALRTIISTGVSTLFDLTGKYAGAQVGKLQELQNLLENLKNPPKPGIEPVGYMADSPEVLKAKLEAIDYFSTIRNEMKKTLAESVKDPFGEIDFGRLKEQAGLTGNYFDAAKTRLDLLVKSYDAYKDKIRSIGDQIEANNRNQANIVEALAKKTAIMNATGPGQTEGKASGNKEIAEKEVADTKKILDQNIANTAVLIETKKALEDEAALYSTVAQKAKELSAAMNSQKADIADANNLLDQRQTLVSSITSLYQSMGANEKDIIKFKQEQLVIDQKIKAILIQTSDTTDVEKAIALNKLDTDVWKEKLGLMIEAYKQTNAYKDALETQSGAKSIRSGLESAFTVDFLGNAEKVRGIESEIKSTQREINEARAKGDIQAIRDGQYKLQQLDKEEKKYTQIHKILGAALGAGLLSIADEFNKRISANFVNKVLDITIGGETLDVKISKAMSKAAGMHVEGMKNAFDNHLKGLEAILGANVKPPETKSLPSIFTGGDEFINGISNVLTNGAKALSDVANQLGLSMNQAAKFLAAKVPATIKNIVTPTTIEQKPEAQAAETKIVAKLDDSQAKSKLDALSQPVIVPIVSQIDQGSFFPDTKKWSAQTLQSFDALHMAAKGISSDLANTSFTIDNGPAVKALGEVNGIALHDTMKDIDHAAAAMVDKIGNGVSAIANKIKQLGVAILTYKFPEPKPLATETQKAIQSIKEISNSTGVEITAKIGPEAQKMLDNLQGIKINIPVDVNAIDAKVILGTFPKTLDLFVDTQSAEKAIEEIPTKIESNINTTISVQVNPEGQKLLDGLKDTQFNIPVNVDAGSAQTMIGAFPKTVDLFINTQKAEEAIKNIPTEIQTNVSINISPEGQKLLSTLNDKKFGQVDIPVNFDLKTEVAKALPPAISKEQKIEIPKTVSPKQSTALVANAVGIAVGKAIPQPQQQPKIPQLDLSPLQNITKSADIFATAADKHTTLLNAVMAANIIGITAALSNSNNELQAINEQYLSDLRPIMEPPEAPAKTSETDAAKALKEGLKATGSFISHAITQSIIAAIAKGKRSGAAPGGMLGEMIGSSFGQSKGIQKWLGKLGFLGGPIGGVLGGVVGSLFGGLFGSKHKEPPAQLAVIEANTAAIEANTNALKNLDASVLNAPSNFVVPIANSGRASGTTNVSISIHAPNTNAREIATEVQKIINRDYERDIITTGSNRRYSL